MNRIAKYKSCMIAYNKRTFSTSKRGNFFQSKPEITNQFLEDPFMIEQLQLDVPEPVLKFSFIFIFIYISFIFKIIQVLNPNSKRLGRIW